jgi:hypothetical protein
MIKGAHGLRGRAIGPVSVVEAVEVAGKRSADSRRSRGSGLFGTLMIVAPTVTPEHIAIWRARPAAWSGSRWATVGCLCSGSRPLVNALPENGIRATVPTIRHR